MRGRFLVISRSQYFRQTIVMDNRPGAGGTIGARTAASIEPQGYTLILISASDTVTFA